MFRLDCLVPVYICFALTKSSLLFWTGQIYSLLSFLGKEED